MLIPTPNRNAILNELFTEGVLVAKKQYSKHLKLDVPNLQVINLMRVYRAHGYVEEQFCWRHFYWTLTPAGIDYVRALLHLKAGVVPNTMKPTARMADHERERDGRGERRPRGEGRGRGRGYGGRGYGGGDAAAATEGHGAPAAQE